MTMADAVVNEQNTDELFLRDNDSLYAMPLKIVPFETPLLRRGRLIKNAALQSAIELYALDDGVSAQILVSDVTPEFGHINFGWKRSEVHPDLALLHRLARQPSYDVYSLRILFRELGFPVESMQWLCLSDDKKQMLNGHMKVFTEPLVRHVYGDSIGEGEDSVDIISLFSDPDTPQALKNLQKLADLLELPIQKIPEFLEDFADIYMSLSYYQQSLEAIVPLIFDMMAQFEELKQSWQMKQDTNLLRACDELVSDLSDLTATTTGRFESFHKNTDRMWENISAERFRSVESMIKGYQTTIGGVLCGLGIKMNAWKKRFPNAKTGGPMARAEFILSSIRPGMAEIMKIDKAPPPVPDLYT